MSKAIAISKRRIAIQTPIKTVKLPLFGRERGLKAGNCVGDDDIIEIDSLTQHGTEDKVNVEDWI
jgi:hypothetical protein